MRPLLATLILTAIAACRHSGANIPPASSNPFDSGITRLLAMADTLPFYDTSTLEFRLLRAWQKRDTANFRRELEWLTESNTQSTWEQSMDSCLAPVESLLKNAEEGYCFDYNQSFNPVATRAVITKSGSDIRLQVTCYRFAWDSAACRILQDKKLRIDSVGWEGFRRQLRASDLWGLKPDNGRGGLDGSTLRVWAVRTGNGYSPQRQAVALSRWSPAYEPIEIPYQWLLQKAGMEYCVLPFSD